MKAYTIIGIWSYTQEPYAEHVEADGPHEAMGTAPEGVEILGAVTGHVAFTTPRVEVVQEDGVSHWVDQESGDHYSHQFGGSRL